MIALEQLLDGSVTARNFDRLRSLVLDTGGQSVGIRFGAETITFTAAASSATVTVNHGLDTTPLVVLLGVSWTSSGRGDVMATYTNLDADSFDVIGTLGDQAVVTTGTATVGWAVIG